MNDDIAWATAIASEILANDPGNPRAVRVFDAAGKKIVTLNRKAASESEVLGDPIDVHLDPDREAKIQNFFYHLKAARALMREIRFSPEEEPESLTARLFNRLQDSRRWMRELTPVFQGTLEYGRKQLIEEIMQPRRQAVREYLKNLAEVRGLARRLVP
jgi:hypothetical protein